MKKQTLIILGIFVATMSSCVYSLFPIYTEDTVVFKEELLGKWDIDDKGSYMLFEQVGSQKDEPKVTKEEYQYSIEIKEGFTLSSDDPIFIEFNGRKIYDEDSIILIMKDRMAKIDVPGKVEKGQPDVVEESKSNGLDLVEEIKRNIKEDQLTPQDVSYEGSVTVFEEKSYQLTIYSADAESCDEAGKKEAYIAHLVDIGGDLFMDLYPVKEFSSSNISDNFFPVHTFFKVAVSEEEFTMTHFDLDKLNKLFESNLIRLRHENVDGAVLITAQPKELQKFLDTYSDDESVFDFTESYQKAS